MFWKMCWFLWVVDLLLLVTLQLRFSIFDGHFPIFDGHFYNIIQTACQVIAANPANPGFFHIHIECGHYSGSILTNKGPH
jgi:hypothetical protein